MPHPDPKARLPGNKKMTLVKNYAVVPNAEWWCHDLRQVAFDE